MHVAVGAIGAYVGYGGYVGYGVGTVVSPVVMEMIEAKIMADTADCMLYFTLSDNLMLLLKIVATSLHQLFIAVVLVERRGGDGVRIGE